MTIRTLILYIYRATCVTSTDGYGRPLKVTWETIPYNGAQVTMKLSPKATEHS